MPSLRPGEQPGLLLPVPGRVGIADAGITDHDAIQFRLHVLGKADDSSRCNSPDLDLIDEAPGDNCEVYRIKAGIFNYVLNAVQVLL
ncbi:MAG: hypothetical protein KAX38_00750 [Candidatus Krumholzibacteria bacterium]|nr:hypothetical protein [Candidatus Krumholzibacteria bacterium]